MEKAKKKVQAEVDAELKEVIAEEDAIEKEEHQADKPDDILPESDIQINEEDHEDVVVPNIGTVDRD